MLILSLCHIVINKMLNFSFVELSLVAVIGLLLLGTEDIIIIIKAAKSLKRRIKEYFEEHFSEFDELISSESIENLMVDSEGEIQKMYDNGNIPIKKETVKKQLKSVIKK